MSRAVRSSLQPRLSPRLSRLAHHSSTNLPGLPPSMLRDPRVKRTTSAQRAVPRSLSRTSKTAKRSDIQPLELRAQAALYRNARWRTSGSVVSPRRCSSLAWRRYLRFRRKYCACVRRRLVHRKRFRSKTSHLHDLRQHQWSRRDHRMKATRRSRRKLSAQWRKSRCRRSES